ncbi:MAG: MBL fold metallo-hydrolase [Sciscionella sp.]
MSLIPAPRTAAPYLQQLADRVHAYVQPDGGWCLNNAGIIVGDSQVVLVDTAATTRRTLALRDAVATLSAAPVRIVVNTHHHGDHTHGNYLFAPTARIIGHEHCAAEILAQGDLLERLWPEVEWGQIQITTPSEHYAAAMTLDIDGITAHLVHIPPAHTTNDTVLWLPEQRVLFTGDLIFSGGMPFILMGSLAGSIAALDRLRAFAPEVIMPGHGPVTTATAIQDTADYLTWLAELASEAHAAGLTPLEAARQADLTAFTHLLNPERVVGNLHRAYAEIDGAAPGAPLDLPAAIGDMAAYSNGRLPQCLA